MKNLTEVSLTHKNLIWYFIIVIALGGIFAFRNLGRMEDPAFTIRQMIVSVTWPGATAREMSEFVADPLEKKLQDTPYLDYIKSENRPGQTRIFVTLKDDAPKEKIRPTWQRVRNFAADAKADMPQNIVGPFFNDNFDDVYGSVYAITGEDYSYEELRREAEKFRRRALTISNAQKAELDGEQKEKVYVEFSAEVLANLNLSLTDLQMAIEGENSRIATGKAETGENAVYIRYSGAFNDIESVKNLAIPINGKVLRLKDIAKVSLRDEEPSEPKMFFNGKKAVGIDVSMEDGGDIIAFGKELEKIEEETRKNLPLGMELHQVADQPEVVKESIGEFTRTLFEAIVIVLLVSFFSLGFRTGLVVAFSIPLVLAAVFLFMYGTGIELHKVSLGALIISLGLLVDDAIIAVEMMSVKLEAGFGKFEAACYAFNETALPMLTGTLITVSGFIPVAFSKGLASEFCSALFPVVGVALIISWIISVMVAPFWGTYLIKAKTGEKKATDGKFYQVFRKWLTRVLAYPKATVIVTVIFFGISLYSFQFIKNEFFPPSIRPELIVNMRLERGSSIEESERIANKLSERIGGLEEIKSYSYYVGKGAPRFVLTLDPELPDDNFLQFIIVATSSEARKNLQAKLEDILKEEFYTTHNKMQLIQTGPPAKAPVMLRVSGDNFEDTRKSAKIIGDYMTENSLAYNVIQDANEEGRIVKLELDNGRLSAMGATRSMVSQSLYGYIDGVKVAEYYKNAKSVPIEARLTEAERDDISKLKNLPIRLQSGQIAPLSQIGVLKLETEPMFIPRRNLKDTITITGELPPNMKTADDATKNALQAISKANLPLPPNVTIKAGGSLEDSGKSLKHLLKPVPIMIFVIMTLLMLQLKNIKDMTLTLLTAPLGLIGVVLGMLIFDASLGFVAELGILALFGMIIRNSVILIDQIKKHISRGQALIDAIIDSCVLRFRPIMLTAAAAILGMVPLMASPFWGSMAIAISSGLLIATILTLLVLPAMYVLTYRGGRK